MSDTHDSTERQTILIVDDTLDNVALLHTLLKNHYDTEIATHGERALQIVAADSPPDLILLDIMMPGMDGYEVCRQLKTDPRTAGIPVIFLTARTQGEDEEKGLKLGAVDYITKPFRPPVVLARIETHLALKNARQCLEDHNAFLEVAVQRRTREVLEVQDATIMAIAALAEARDNESGNHLRRTQQGVRALAQRLRAHPRFARQLNAETIELLFKAAPLHDIGKVAIPDRILFKPSGFTPEEFEIMKTHTTQGGDAMRIAEQRLGIPNLFLRYAREIACFHHERWDGAGYPAGLAGEDIPLPARLMAVADAYDTLVGRGMYKIGIPHGEAVEVIRAGRGAHFDPDIVDAFLDIADQFQTITALFPDDHQALQEELKRLEVALVEETIVLGGDSET